MSASTIETGWFGATVDAAVDIAKLFASAVELRLIQQVSATRIVRKNG